MFGVVQSLAMAIAARVRAKCTPISGLLVLFANARVVCAAAYEIDFSGFAGGGHSRRALATEGARSTFRGLGAIANGWVNLHTVRPNVDPVRSFEVVR